MSDFEDLLDANRAYAAEFTDSDFDGVARAGERPVPPWLEVISSQLRVLVHAIPARQVIDTPVQEQLIVELYSKN